MMELELDNGKYTYIYDSNGRHEALRHGEPWRNLVGDNLILYMGFYIQGQQQEIDALKAQLQQKTDIWQEMYDALKAFIKSAGLDEKDAAQPVPDGPLDMVIKAVAKAEGAE